jgi:ketosteroid isomerase-like protein
MARTPQEVFTHHAGALAAEDVDELVADYADDAVLVTAAAVWRGKDEIRDWCTAALADLAGAEWAVPVQVFEGDVLFIEWTALAEKNRVDDGVDTFVFRDGSIAVQTVHCTVRPRE